MGKLHFGLQVRQTLNLLMQPCCSLTNPAMGFVKCARVARRSHTKRTTVCSKLPVKMADLRHTATYLYYASLARIENENTT